MAVENHVDKKSKAKKYISRDEIVKVTHDRTTKAVVKGLDYRKSADSNMNNYLKLSKSKHYINPRTIKGIGEYIPIALEAYKQSQESYITASRSEMSGSDAEKELFMKERRSKKAVAYGKTADEIGKIIENISLMHSDKLKKNKKSDSLEGFISEGIAIPILSMVSFFFALMFSSFSVTGFVTANKITSPINYIALGCFILGILFAGIYLKRRANSKKKIAENKKVQAKKKPSVKKKVVSKKVLVKKKK